MEDRGGATANHYDHVHVTTNGHGFPGGDLHLYAPEGGSGTYSPGQATSDCTLDPGAPVGDDLAPGSVPPQFAPWLRKAGAICPHIKPSLLAAQIHQESGFNATAVSGSGAQGPGQFMPETWPSYGRDDDGNGQVSPFDIGDAVMAQGRYMCAIAAAIDPAITSGKVKAPNGAAELYLAGYNAGEGAVLSAGGFPSGSADYVNQTRPYVDTILANEPKYAAVNQ
ncbi:lytic transglycosylase domain-containing protein [Aldersonia sp. NBC_00410]|nr:lytic transglycosylase domain-containing protein [Aldersonia sp. NBC_00410]